MYLLVCDVHGRILCSSNITKRFPMHVTHMHRYMAVPRTPVQTDRLDTTEASAVYRATRDNININNNNCDHQVIEELLQNLFSYFVPR